ncbi:PIG3 family NAD(P)H quinone oxidoreductase-like protein [Pyronema domesticum]|uniref:Similar to Quinone oxidoreductase PIG3 acc. no. Q53FA7 n=1 Tax=Pyronema omphalodes (strain CBS 100304) TaxID=1076935 RepID=U4LKW2_PYROM|nr:PIG3 family NAD(P)H quinone oxidoreductase-like protein [Pyronema domesticum]CCX32217.1 Similar to Quinone oxidoreductase PIG3; acc. no. Q53FA7 [Pyronema omphalodes CBS 100304]
MATMRAVDIQGGVGDATKLFINDQSPVPELKDGELLVKVKAFGLNRMDLMQRQGMYPLPPQAPKTLGVEFSGTVEKVSGDVGDFKVNDAVFGLAYGGAYAEYIAVNAKMCIHKPKEVSWVQAAGIPEVWITATQALWTVGRFKPGMRVLIHAGASGVGIAAVQLAKHAGAAAVYVTAGSDEKIKFCVEQLGADAGFNYKTQNFAEEIMKATENKGVDLIVDPVGQTHFQKDIDCAARDGAIVVLAMMSGPVAKEVNIGPILFKRLRIEGTTLRSRDLEYQRALRDKVVEEALPGIVDGSLKVFVDKVFDWTDIIEAHKHMESNDSQGKIICTTNYYKEE